jgi:predicted transglutaminase-like cysteine proteinase
MSWRYIIAMAGFIAYLTGNADGRSPAAAELKASPPIVEAAPTLAPFQHVRFCLRYPSDCTTSTAHIARIELDQPTMDLLIRVNRDVNLSITAMVKTYGSDLEAGWTIAPDIGDCNDYAVTKRHKLLESGLPSPLLRLSVLRTASGVGHLVLVVATTKGDMVMDNLTDAIRPWQLTNYHWVKIQSATNPRFWSEVRSPAGPLLSQANRDVRVAGR